MKGISNAKLPLLQPSVHKHGGAGGGSVASIAVLGTHHRLWLITFASFLTFASLLSLQTTTTTGVPSAAAGGAGPTHLPSPVFDALLHYAAASNATGRMPDADRRAIASVVRRRAPCNLLVFGLDYETPLWRALNHGGRTVFLDESEYYVARLEDRHPGLEAYDVAYTTRVDELRELLDAVRQVTANASGDCRPSQNLLFSDCQLAINDLPNDLYDVAWDVILIDGPRGYDPASPGRMSAIFTAAVMARYRGAGPTDVLVHDYEREVERVCSDEFLCRENLVAAAGGLAHFAVHGGGGRNDDRFCVNRTAEIKLCRKQPFWASKIREEILDF